MTPRLYWDDPLLLAFEARVVAHAAPSAMILDTTAFYPESGGQLADRGRVQWDGGESAITDAQEDEGGRVLHVLAGSPPPIGAVVRVQVDEARRRDHMAQHTGQHMLSRALLDRAGADTVSSRLGDSICTVDTSLAKVADERVADAEDLANAVVLEDRPVRALHPSPEELGRMKLRRDPKVSDNVRIIDVDGFDLSPCGGTHCQRTGQVGLVRIVGIERYKGGLRISFHAGARARRDYADKDRVLSNLTRELTCGPDGVLAAVTNLRTELREEKRAAASLRERLATYVGAELLARAEPGPGGCRWVAAVLTNEPPDALRAIAASIATHADAVAVLAASSPEGIRVIVQRGASAPVDAGALLKRLATACGGRGGGSAARAEGSLPTGSAVAEAFASLRVAPR